MLRQMKDWLRGVGGSPKTAQSILADPVLGPMIENQQIKGSLVAQVRWEDRNIELSVDPDGERLEDSLKIARLLSKSLKHLDKKARSVASSDLLEEYNESWRFFGVTREDGTVEDVENPKLTQDEFEATIILNRVDVTGGMLTFCYSAKGLFAGHSIFVDVFDGLSFTDTNATLFG